MESITGLRCLISMPFAENSYVLWQPGNSQAVVIDPGLEPGLILDCLGKENLKVAAILNTHGHVDHIAGNAAVKEAFPDAPLIIGAGDAIMLSDAMANLSGLFGMPIVSPPADRTVQEGDRIEAAGFVFEVFDLPGHSPGHVVFVERTRPSRVFAGDTLFAGGIGRVDFPGGNGPLLLEGIRKKLFTLPPDTLVYSGHGDSTNVGEEMRSNPFLSK